MRVEAAGYSELISLRVRVELLERDLSQILHLYYATLVWILSIELPGLSDYVRKVVRAKILQLPQGSRIGQRLIELDEQSGCLLQSHDIWLGRWVYEPRERHHE